MHEGHSVGPSARLGKARWGQVDQVDKRNGGTRARGPLQEALTSAELQGSAELRGGQTRHSCTRAADEIGEIAVIALIKRMRIPIVAGNHLPQSPVTVCKLVT